MGIDRLLLQALRCRQLGINTMIVLEQFSELATLLAVSKQLGIRPVIGVRAKLHTRNNVGHWGSTSGGGSCYQKSCSSIVHSALGCKRA